MNRSEFTTSVLSSEVSVEHTLSTTSTADKLKAIQRLFVEIREVSFFAESRFDLCRNPVAPARYWHLLGFAEGIVERMESTDGLPSGAESWVGYVETRLTEFKKLFQP